MNDEEFSGFVDQVSWRFAKSVPNWPHFYIVERELKDQAAIRAAKSFIRDAGRDGRFYDSEVRYYDSGGWTYWASPLSEPLESQHMLNRCKTEFTYESLAESGMLPPEGFQETRLALSPVLEDPEFMSLVRDTNGSDFNVFEVLGTADYEIRHSSVLSWLLNRAGNHGQGSSFAEMLWGKIGVSLQHNLPELSFDDYTVDREGSNEDERIDLLLVAKDRSWIIVIENKLFSPETGDQLDRYFNCIERCYSDVAHRLYFYLTPHGIGPKSQDDASHWYPISYQTVKDAVSEFLNHRLAARIEDFVEQYLEHIERNVLKSTGMTERMRNILRRYGKMFHSLEFVLENETVRAQCGDAEFNLLKSILAVQQEVEAELFEFTKKMMTRHDYKRFSGLGHWITIEIPGLKESLNEFGLLSEKDTSPFVFAFDSTPHSYRVEIWIYKKASLYSKIKGGLTLYSAERPEPNRGDEHLVEVLFRRTIISSDRILQESISGLKDRIAEYFGSELQVDLAEATKRIGGWANTTQAPSKRMENNG